MLRAQIDQWGQPPRVAKVSIPQTDELIRIYVKAAGLHRVVKSRASGNHYSAKELPHIPGIDGVGTTEDGEWVYFITFGTNQGSFSEIVQLPPHSIFSLPTDADPTQVAALMNPLFSSWMALKSRCENLPENFTVLVLGVTSMSGSLAVQLSRHLGAGKVIGCARNVEAMQKMNLDDFVQLESVPTETDFARLGDVDVILDYVYGEAAAHLLGTLPGKRLTQYVHIGGLSATEMMFPGSALRSKNLVIRGSGPGAFGMGELFLSIPSLLQCFGTLEKQQVKQVPLLDVAEGWSDQAKRIVFTC